MKNILLLLLLCGSLTAGTAQTAGTNHALAEVNQMQGIHLFFMCKPVTPYTYLGSVKIKIVWSGRPDEMVDVALKKIKKEYPTADGIIFTTALMDQIDAIKFKE